MLGAPTATVAAMVRQRTPLLPPRQAMPLRHKPVKAHITALRLSSILTPKNLIFGLTISVSALIWSQQVGFLGPLPLSLSSATITPTESPQHAGNQFQHGQVNVDRVIWYEGDVDSSAAKTNQSDMVVRGRQPIPAISRPSRDSPQDQTVTPESNNRDASFDKSIPDRQDAPTPAAADADAGKSRLKKQTPHTDPLPPPQSPQQTSGHISGKIASAPPNAQSRPENYTQSSSPKKDTAADKSDQQPNNNPPDNNHVEEKKSSTASNTQTTNNTDGKPVEATSLRWREILNFSPKTAVNFMHFHKTGGVSFKTSLHIFFKNKTKANGNPVIVRDSCYSRKDVSKDPNTPTFLQWRCDWAPIHEMNEADRNNHDFIFGHQFWKNGADDLLNKRDLRTFTILRHPFDRKVSFYFHFFIRELNRKEADVTFAEIRDFLLYDKLLPTIKADLGRDLGPNYMAGRLLSNGVDGYVGDKSHPVFNIKPEEEDAVVEKALNRIRDYVFVGLQEESSASKCMLRKVVELFNEVNGVNNSGAERIDEGAAVLNRGSYSLSAKVIWQKLTAEEQDVFSKKERVDIKIYQEGERLFRKHVRMFECAHRIVEDKRKRR